MPDTIIDLIRHGEPVGGRAYRGHNIDDPLSELGWQQMWDAVARHCPWSHIVSSPMLRCRDFAEALAKRHGLDVSIDERLQEVGFGEWEGKSPEQLQQQRPAEYAAFYADPVNRRPPGAEGLEGFIKRVVAAYAYLLEHYAGRHVLVVTHAGVIRAVIAHVVHAAPRGMYRIKVNNAGITRVRVTPRGAMLEYHNSTHK